MGLHDGKTAIVTGSSRGLGRAMAKRLLEEGANVVVSATTQEGAEKAADELRAQTGGSVLPIACQITSGEHVSALVERTVAKFGGIDILVNNAGITRDKSLMKMTEESFDAVINTNLKSVFLLTQAAAKHMREAGWGRVINITSMSGQMGNFGQVNYSASKAGIIGMTKTLAIELGPKNITVNAVSPGLIESDMTQAMPKEAYDANIAAIVLHRVGKPEEVASLVSYLASEDAGFITGATININGGMYR
ncbi:MAG: 3-oxoacyl-ACP reductase FabG [Oscillospiraceae bacterium]|jgi:3-oxoacyl-[acyl-carrier protein] reductase|nr:3-oxoacyl-ACP reductase FabG [Oscillospiraceae bacterium]